MLTTSKSSGKSKRILFGVISLAFLSAIIVVGFADRITHHLTGSADVPVRSERAARKVERAEARSADETSAPRNTASQPAIRSLSPCDCGWRRHQCRRKYWPQWNRRPSLSRNDFERRPV